MTTLGVQLVWCFFQVSVLLGAATVVYVLTARRSPDMAAWALSWFLGLTLLITPLAFVPLPSWISILTASSAESAQLSPTSSAFVSRPSGTLPHGSASGSLKSDESSAAVNATTSFWLELGRQLLQQLELNHVAANEEGLKGSRWLRTCAWLLLGGTALGLGRFLHGMVQLNGLLRGSQLVEDQPLTAELQALRREMGCRSTVRIYESHQLNTAATFGWLRPLILLPAAWREWTFVERRAVLAHELAHIGRGDFAAWWLARLSLAIHGYHPLLYWLVNRLQLQQELAADAAAARAADSRLTYLKVLAAMMLRHDDTRRNGLVRAFLPASTTLSRRIAMLRVKDDRSLCSNTRHCKLAVIASGLIAAVTAATFRIEADDQAPVKAAVAAKAESTSGPTSSNTPGSSVPQVSVQAKQGPAKPAQTRVGVIAIRPAKLFGHAGAQALLAKASQALVDPFRENFFPSIREVHLDRIDEVTAHFAYSYDASKPDNRRTIYNGLDALRVVKGVDIARWFQQTIPTAQVTRGQHATIHSLPASEVKFNLSPQMKSDNVVSFVEIQPGTIGCIGMPADSAAEYATGKKSWRFASEDFAGWHRVNRGVLTFACNEQLAQIAKELDLSNPAEAAFKPVLQHLRQVLGCVELEDELKAEMILEVNDAASAQEVKQAIDALLLLGRAVIAQQVATPEGTKMLAERAGFKAYVEAMNHLLDAAQIEVVGKEIRITSHAKVPVDRIALLFSSDVK